jgi:hypothetical protein
MSIPLSRVDSLISKLIREMSISQYEIRHKTNTTAQCGFIYGKRLIQFPYILENILKLNDCHISFSSPTQILTETRESKVKQSRRNTLYLSYFIRFVPIHRDVLRSSIQSLE